MRRFSGISGSQNIPRQAKNNNSILARVRRRARSKMRARRAKSGVQVRKNTRQQREW